MFKYHLVFSWILAVSEAFSQAPSNGPRFRYPLDQAPVLTGNYGEIRPNHFHAGIDFVTDPKINLPIYAAADGYVSRIKISPYGYGKVLYVTHANGLVTVYAHEHHFNWKINKYVTQKQTEQQKNEIELFPAPGELPVKQSELIGYTGNTGGSTGPHLHFEVREEKSEVPLNPLLIYHLPDTVKPQVTQLAIYQYKDSMLTPVPKMISAKHKLAKSDSSTVQESLISIGFAGFDKENTGANPNNIYDAKLFFDNVLIYHHQLDQISFDNGKFVNAFSEKIGDTKVQRCFAPRCYDIPIYKTLINRGLINLRDTAWHQVTLKVADERNNESTVTQYIRSTLKAKPAGTSSMLQDCSKPYIYKSEAMEIEIPAFALYNAAVLNPAGTGIGSKNDYLQKPAKVRLKIAHFKPELTKKYVLLVNGNAVMPALDNDWLVAECKSLGSYGYTTDTVAPSVKPVWSKKKLLNIAAAKSISFKITDALSGIERYDIFINNVWQIAEYDAKADLLTCYFSGEAPVGKITLRVVVEDKCGNIKEALIHTARQ